jgi:Flp pilus assembly pilin Flp
MRDWSLGLWVRTVATRDQRGATAVEFLMIVALVAAILVTVVAALGGIVAAPSARVGGGLP